MANLFGKVRTFTTDLLAEALAKANRIAPLRASQFVGASLPHGFSAQTEIDTERGDANIAVAVRLIGSAIAGLPLDVKEMTYDQGKLALIDASDHPANELVKNPNPFNPPTDIKLHAAQSLVLTGNAVFSLEKQNSRTPNELWPLEFPSVEISRTQEGIPTQYKYQPRREGIPFEADEICHIRLYHCTKAFYGRSAIDPIKRNILSDMYSENIVQQFFKKGAVLDGILWPEESLLPEQIESLRKQIDARHSGQSKAFGWFIPPFKGKYEPVTPSIKDMMFDTLLKINREKIYAVLGIPPSVGGVYEFANYANAAIQRKTYWEDTIIPLLIIIEEALTRQIIWKHFDTDHVYKFDISGVPALKEDALVRAQTHSIYVRSGILTPNEIRAEIGKEPVEGGDELAGQVSIQDLLNAQSPSEPGDTKPNEEDTSRTGGDGKAIQTNALGLIRLKSSPIDVRMKHWKRWYSRTVLHEVAFARVMAGYFNKQRGRVLSRIEDVTSKGAFMARLYFAYKADPTPDDADFIFDMSAETAALSSLVKPEFRRVMKEAFRQTAGDIGIDIAFNLNNPKVQVAIDGFWNRIKDINDTSYDEIKDVLRQAYDEGWGIPKLEREIRSLYSQWSNGTALSQSRALTIARTEMSGVVNSGNVQAYEAGGYEGLEWVVAPGAVNPRHEEIAGLDGQRVRMGEPFLVDGEFLEYPGDPNGSPWNVINCHCTTIGLATLEG